VKALVIRRPSLSIRTPYVADVVLSEGVVHPSDPTGTNDTGVPLVYSVKPLTPKEEKQRMEGLVTKMSLYRPLNTVVTAHAPSLDCGGTVVPGNFVYCTVNGKKTVKTNLTIQHCEEIREDGRFVRVGYHPSIAETACRAMLDKRLLDAELGRYTNLDSQYTYGTSRFDYRLVDDVLKTCTLLEVKNVPCADYPAGGKVPLQRGSVGVYESTLQPYVRSAIFPHGSLKPGIGVVSDRAIKHVHGLTEIMVGKRLDPEGRTLKCAILFVVNRSDCVQFRPCHEADMLFAQVLKKAEECGVRLICKSLVWEGDSGRCTMGPTLPVVFHESVKSADIDEKHLKDVLAYNAA
jgi:DNA-binding sugar fermentation-stimulating protein